MTDNVNLTECEQIVMKAVWDSRKDVSLVEIMAIVHEKYGREWKRQTVSTFLLHLIQKNYLSSYRVWRVFYYHQLVLLVLKLHINEIIQCELFLSGFFCLM